MKQEPQFDPALKELLLRRTGHHLGEKLTNAEEPVAVVMRLTDSAAALPPEVRVVARLGEVVTARVPIGQIVALRRHPAVASLKASGLFVGDLARSVPDIRADRRHLAALSQPPLNGRGVIIAVLDWGLDWAHEAFLDPAGQSRVLHLWDQRGGPSPRSPQPWGYGTEYHREDLDRALQAADPYAALGYDPAEIDPAGVGTHGTHVLSIAAGSGRLPGVAPAADLMFVHLASPDTAPTDTLGDSARVLEAVDYVLQRAGDRPVVINMSLGRTGDAKDGSSPVERALDAVLRERPGRAICMSTGNYFNARLHASGRLRSGGTRTLSWEVPPFRREAPELEIWYSGRDQLRATLIAPNGRRVASVEPGQSRVLRHRGRLVASAFSRLDDPNNHDNMINLFLHEPARSGLWRVELQALEVRDGRFHAWIERAGLRSQSRFAAEDADPLTTIGTIACGHLTLACGAYDPRDPQRRLGEFSSSGPTRDGRQVPVLCAPGDGIGAAGSSWIDLFGHRHGNGYVIKRGTSMAAPHCAGVVALMMQAALPERLDAATLRDILQRTAHRPRHVRPQDRWRVGAGFIDARGAVAAVLARRRPRASPVMTHPIRHPAPAFKEESAMPVHALPRTPLPPEALSLAEDILAPAAGAAAEIATPRLVRDHARLEWTDLTLVPGSNNVPRLYYLVTGNPDTGRAHFRLQIRNLTSRSLRNATIKWRFSSQQSDGSWRTIPIPGSSEGRRRLDADYFVARAPGVSPNGEITRELLIRRDLLEQAYDPDYPRCRMEVEYHWYEGSTPYYNRHALSFFLMRPVEFLLRSATAAGEVHLNRPEHKPHFWIPVRGKWFKGNDRTPVTVSGTLSTSVSASRGQQVGVRASTRTEQSTTHGTSTTVGSEVSSSFSIGIEKIFEAGLSSTVSSSQTRSFQWSQSLSRELSREVVHNRTFTRAYTRSQTIQWTIAPAPPNTIRTLYGYPVFRQWNTRIVRFGTANRWGQATRREVLDDFPLLLLSHWVDVSEVAPAREVRSRLPRGGFVIGEAEADDESESIAIAENLARISRLAANQVRHLALEGGGGKGMVYLGAIQALESLGVLRYSGGRLTSLRGISGSSAGAIPALALSLGLDARALDALLRGPSRVRFNEFFDLPADPRKLPRLSGCRNAPRNSVIDRHLFRPLEALLRGLLDAAIPDAASRLSSRLDPATLARTAVARLRRELHQRAVNPSLRPGDARDKLLSPAALFYLINLIEDFGLFSGCRARQFADSLVAQRNGGRRNMTFADHLRHFNVRLVLTGSNLETGRTEFFSAATTPDMPVADAVRISMGLPFIYKPVRIDSAKARRITRGRNAGAFQGLWVDGGLWNNLPLRAFDQPGRDARTLGLRLGVPGRVRIDSLSAFVERYVVDLGLLGSGEANQAASTGLGNRMITLDTSGLETTDFNPPATVVGARIRDARRATEAYFRRRP